MVAVLHRYRASNDVCLNGVVSIKLAQMLAEEAKVPLYYRRLLGGLRESNEPMHVSLFWHSIPKSVRRHIKELGNCIGTGSVKQVHICRFDDGKDYAVAVLRRNVEEEALSSLDALTNAEDVAIVAKRLGRLVFGEFNLFSEGEATSQSPEARVGNKTRAGRVEETLKTILKIARQFSSPMWLQV